MRVIHVAHMGRLKERLNRTEEVRLFPSMHVGFCGGQLEPRPRSPTLPPDHAFDAGSKQARGTCMTYLADLFIMKNITLYAILLHKRCIYGYLVAETNLQLSLLFCIINVLIKI